MGGAVKRRFASATGVLAILLGTTSAQAKAPSGRYQVVADGVLDTRTHLTWQNPAPASAPWDEAKTYCASVGTGWRLPTLKELETLIDYAAVSASLVDPIFADTQPLEYWSSTPARDAAGYAWTLTFQYGEAMPERQTSRYSLRCVR